MSRRTLAVVTLAVWVGLLAWHVRREYFAPALTRLAEATLTLAPGTHFHILRMGDAAIGLSSSRLDTIPEGFRIEDQMNLELSAMGQTGSVVARTEVTMTRTLFLRSFGFSLESADGQLRADGVVEGDSLLRVRLESGGAPEEVTYRLSEPPLLASALPIRLAKGGELREGRTFRFAVFDPSSVSLRTVEVDVVERGMLVLPDSAVYVAALDRWEPASEREIQAWRIRERYGGVQVESWIDEDGRVIRSSSPMGFSIERTPYELALQERERSRATPGASGATAPDVILATAIASNLDLGEVEAHETLRFVLSGVDLEGFELEGGRQELRGDTLVVRRERWASIDPGYDLPYPRMDLRAALEPEPLIQSADPRIASVARNLARVNDFGTGDPKAAAERLALAVYGAMEKEVSFTLPSALQVLERMRGDCNEHTVLYVALARAVGLPARSAVGLVYLDGAFYYHAWPEVWLGEWVAVDPTFGQVPADAAHLRFMTGSLAQQVEVARLVGTLRIEALGAE